MIGIIYIIGKKVAPNSISCKSKFNKAQMFLEDKGFRVVNPIATITNEKLDINDAIQTNIKSLMRCNSVYILPDVSINKTQNVELLLAIELKLIILQGIEF